jgi:ABC-type Mn2+/Zn2+ transport system permease subunit
MGISAVVSILAVLLGLLAAFYWDLPASGAIVLLSFLFFLILFSVHILKRHVTCKAKVARRSRRQDIKGEEA